MPDLDVTAAFLDTESVVSVPSVYDYPTFMLEESLEDATLEAFVWTVLFADFTLNETLEDATLTATVWHTRTITLTETLAAATLESTVELGVVDVPVVLPAIYNLTGQVRDSGGAILCFVGAPNKTIDWRLLSGNGTLTPFTTFTDELGRCSCRYDAAGLVEDVVIGAAYVL